MFALSNVANADGHVKWILQRDETALGNDIVYRLGKTVTAFECKNPVGGPVTSHTHTFPVLVIMQECEAMITYEDGKVSVCKTGEAFIEDMGTVPVRALIVAIGVEGQKLIAPVK